MGDMLCACRQLRLTLHSLEVSRLPAELSTAAGFGSRSGAPQPMLLFTRTKRAAHAPYEEDTMSQHISVVGHIATDPKKLVTKKGDAFCTFRLAVNDRRYDASVNGWVDGETNWFTVNVYRHLGANALQSFTKGERVIVVGKLRVSDWSTGEKQGTNVEIDADSIGHDLQFGVSSFSKRAQPSARAADSPDAGHVQSDEQGSSDPEDGSFIPSEAGSEDQFAVA